MKCSFWNSKGLCDLAKHRFINESIWEHKLDCIAFLRREDQALSHFFNNRAGVRLWLVLFTPLIVDPEASCQKG